MRVVACIVGFRNPEDVTACVAALARSTHRDLEVLICENGGPDAHAALVAALPPALPGGGRVEAMLAPGNLGYAGGVNTCLRARPDADAWWVVNPDAEPETEALAALLARLAEGDVDAVGGTILQADGRVQGHGGRWRSWLARAESIGWGDPGDRVPDRAAVERRLDYLLGASMLVGRRFLSVAGPMREDYFLYGEEVEWFLRARARGLRLGFAPGARIRHGQGSTTGSADRHAARPRMPIHLDERNKLNVVRDTAPWRLPVATLAAPALLALRFARRGAWRQWGWGMLGWWAGVRDERGVPPWMR